MRAWKYSRRASGEDHRPSAPSTTLAASTWVCSWGSPFREVRWTKAAATNPEVSIRLSPPAPRRAMVAWRSRYSSPSATARSWAARTAAEVSESLSPHSTETDLGAEKVRSNPDTRAEAASSRRQR